MPKNFSFINETGKDIPEIPFNAIKTAALGPRYEMSVIITSSDRMKELNKTYRKLHETTDILSFPVSGSEGEIYLCPTEARHEAKKFDRPYENFLAFLFIHGCIHLKGYDHGSTMEKLEAKLQKKFGI